VTIPENRERVAESLRRAGNGRHDTLQAAGRQSGPGGQGGAASFPLDNPEKRKRT